MKKLGGLSSLMEKMPVEIQGKASAEDMDKAERDMRRMQGIIHAMTPAEREKPELIKATRKRRIAAGAGVGGDAGVYDADTPFAADGAVDGAAGGDYFRRRYRGGGDVYRV